MTLSDELIDIVIKSVPEYDRRGAIVPMKRLRLVADQPEKFEVRTVHGKPVAVVSIASTITPSSEREAGERALAARARMGERLGAWVLLPLAVADCGGLSLVITPYCEPIARSGLRRKFQLWQVRDELLGWLLRVTTETAHVPTTAERDANFTQPLTAISRCQLLSQGLRREAERALSELRDGTWSPRHVVAHNDLWDGNILRAPGSAQSRPNRFVVIDWLGSRVSGHAMYDLARLSASLGLPGSRVTEQIRLHSAAIECEAGQALNSLLAALGQLSQNLGQWPMERFVQVSEKCVELFSLCAPR